MFNQNLKLVHAGLKSMYKAQPEVTDENHHDDIIGSKMYPKTKPYEMENPVKIPNPAGFSLLTIGEDESTYMDDHIITYGEELERLNDESTISGVLDMRDYMRSRKPPYGYPVGNLLGVDKDDVFKVKLASDPAEAATIIGYALGFHDYDTAYNDPNCHPAPTMTPVSIVHTNSHGFRYTTIDSEDGSILDVDPVIHPVVTCNCEDYDALITPFNSKEAIKHSIEFLQGMYDHYDEIQEKVDKEYELCKEDGIVPFMCNETEDCITDCTHCDRMCDNMIHYDE